MYVDMKILHYQFGYDMILNKFYLVEKETAKTVVARLIGSRKNGNYTGKEYPVVEDKKNEEYMVAYSIHRGSYLLPSGSEST